MRSIIGVIGGHSVNTTLAAMRMAEAFGAEAARRDLAIVCAGYDGIMEAACRGCKQAGGTTIAILKGTDRRTANRYIDYPILTSMDVACNNIIVWTALGLVAFDGRFGTLNEIALALDFGKPLVAVGKHELLNTDCVRSGSFAHVEGYATERVPEILDLLLAMVREARRE